MNCLWYSLTGGSNASPARNRSHRRSIQLKVGRFASLIASSDPALQNTTPGEGEPLPAFSSFSSWFALAPHANPITRQALSVNVTSSAVSPASVRAATAAVLFAAEAQPAAVRATD